jgi:hypothetical protein
MRAALLGAVVLLFAVAGCSQRHWVSIVVQRPPAPPPATVQRTLIETPPPATIPNPPLPALKPGTELSLAESEALADQASPKPPLETQITASQRAMGRAVRKTANLPATGANAPSVTDALHLMGLSQTHLQQCGLLSG